MRRAGWSRRLAGPGLGAALLGALAAPVAAGPDGPAAVQASSPGEHIIGGTATKVGDYPTVVGLTIGTNLCTGTLIAPSWVLTAGHCVDPAVLNLPTQDDVTRNTRVHFDTVDVVNDLGTVVEASATFKDPRFDRTRLGSADLGLIQLATPVTRVAPSPINLSAAMAPVGTIVTIVGYGSTEQGATGSLGIEFALSNRISTSCTELKIGSDANLLCFSQADHQGTCQGDSGGPAFAMIGGRPTVVGVTSFGDQQCAMYGADTRIDIEQDFLLEHVPELVGCIHDGDCSSDRICFAHACIAAPFSATGLGTACGSAADCDSSVCAESSQDGKRCSLACSVADSSSCPDGFECLKSTVSVGACWPQAGGCCEVGGRGGAGTAMLGLGVVAMALRRRRRPRG